MDLLGQNIRKLGFGLMRLPKQNDIIDVELDFHHDNVLLLINRLTVKLYGPAVKYQDLPARH